MMNILAWWTFFIDLISKIHVCHLLLNLVDYYVQCSYTCIHPISLGEQWYGEGVTQTSRTAWRRTGRDTDSRMEREKKAHLYFKWIWQTSILKVSVKHNDQNFSQILIYAVQNISIWFATKYSKPCLLGTGITVLTVF